MLQYRIFEGVQRTERIQCGNDIIYLFVFFPKRSPSLFNSSLLERREDWLAFSQLLFPRKEDRLCRTHREQVASHGVPPMLTRRHVSIIAEYYFYASYPNYPDYPREEGLDPYPLD